MSCPRCGNNKPNTVIYECKNCGTIYCITWKGGMFPSQESGCANNSTCPKCRKSPGSNARQIRRI